MAASKRELERTVKRAEAAYLKMNNIIEVQNQSLVAVGVELRKLDKDNIVFEKIYKPEVVKLIDQIVEQNIRPIENVNPPPVGEEKKE